MSPRTKPLRRTTPRTQDLGAVASAHVEELSDLDTEALAALFALRPDLVDPTPSSFAELEARAFSLPSVLRALRQADSSVLQVVQLFTLIGDKHVAVADVQHLMGQGAELPLARAIAWLEARHLVVSASESELCVHPALLAIIGAAGLGPPASELVEKLTVTDIQSVLKAWGMHKMASRRAELVRDLLGLLGDQDAVSTLVERAPAEARALAYRISLGSASLTLPWEVASSAYRAPSRDEDGPGWLLRRGLVYRDSWLSAVMPREVGLALRGGRPFPVDSYLRPRIELPARPEPPVADVVSRASALSQAVERIVECLGARPAAVLKTGGVGVREARRLAVELEVPERDAFVLLEIAAAAGVVAEDTRRGLVLPAPYADDWLALDLPARWWSLAQGWLHAPWHLGMAGATDTRGKVIPALAWVPDDDDTAAAPQRLGVLALACELQCADPEADVMLADLTRWDAPLVWSEVHASLSLVVRWVLHEMELLGLAAHGAPTPLARALVEEDEGAARALLADADSDAWELVLQGDLTALATGRVPPMVRAELTLLAEVEGRGAAALYRFSERSVRRAFDAGRTGEEVMAFLAAHAAKGVPQALAYLVGDVERRHGHIRLGQATCHVSFDDPALATEVLRSKKTAKLGLRAIAPTVLVSASPLGRVLEALREAGYMPVEERDDGTVVCSSVAPERAEASRSRTRFFRAATPRVPRAGSGSGTRDARVTEREGLRELAESLLATPRPAGQGRSERTRPAVAGRVEIPTMLRRPRVTSSDIEHARFLGAPGLDGRGLDGGFGAGLDDFGAGLDDEDDTALDDDALDALLVALERDELGLDAEADADAGADAGDAHATSAGAPGTHVERPSEIAYSPAAIQGLLELAAAQGWLVRLSYTSGAGKTLEVVVDVLDVSERAMVGQVAPRWSEQRYVLERIGWARVLTDAEEELS
jgi:hypothetical protein